MQTIKCVKCGLEAEYDSPDHFCAEHWAEWWLEPMRNDPTVTSEQYQREYQEVLRIAKDKSDD